MTPNKNVKKIFARWQELNPHPKSDLEYTNPYTLLVAVVLSAQTTDKGVNAATRDLFRAVDTPEKMVALGEQALSEKIKTIGLWRAKAKNVIALSQLLLDKHDGKVPSTREDLTALPGVGRKTANVVLNTAFGEPTLAVDTHVFRVSHRLHLADGKTPEQVETQLLEIIPAEFRRHAHHWLILHGRYTCTARKPKCGACPVQQWCPSAGISEE